jgi:nicotinate-nucleotide pyrophosphorylase (carboxylating)
MVERFGDRALLEASGGIDLDNVRAYAETGVQRISCGALTHSVIGSDVALEIDAGGGPR